MSLVCLSLHYKKSFQNLVRNCSHCWRYHCEHPFLMFIQSSFVSFFVLVKLSNIHRIFSHFEIPLVSLLHGFMRPRPVFLEGLPDTTLIAALKRSSKRNTSQQHASCAELHPYVRNPRTSNPMITNTCPKPKHAPKRHTCTICTRSENGSFQAPLPTAHTKLLTFRISYVIPFR